MFNAFPGVHVLQLLGLLTFPLHAKLFATWQSHASALCKSCDAVAAEEQEEDQPGGSHEVSITVFQSAVSIQNLQSVSLSK